MKKSLLFLLAASVVLALASCNKSVTADIPAYGSDEIVFGADLIRVGTKAFSESTNSSLQADGFNAAAVIDADNSAMFNKAVAYANGVYSIPGEHHYWPKTGTMSFYGVYPKTQAVSVDSGVATLSYTQNADTDLIAAKAAAVSKTDGEVVIAFDHILSQLSIEVQGGETTVDYKLFSLTLTAPDGGTYAYADGSWTPSATTADNSVYSNESGMEVSTSAMTAVGDAMSFIPGDISLNVVWKCYNKGTSTVICEKDVTVDVTIPQGKHTTLNLTLPFDSSYLSLNSSVGAWTPDSQDIEIEEFEPVFTVNASGKQVKFAPGNLYWDGTQFMFEEHQYDYPESWDASHVGRFYWSKTASVAYAENYSDSGKTKSDVFFAVNGEAIRGYTVLNKDEWTYLIDNSLEKASDKPKVVTVAGKNCVILKPDGFSESGGTVAGSYTAETWATAESKHGLVALPLTGSRSGSSLYTVGSSASYWSSTPDDDDSSNAWSAYFPSDPSDNGHALECSYRKYGRSVRLVKVVE